MVEKDKLGGMSAREGKGPLWKFTGRNDGSFIAPDAEYISRLFFPLINQHGMKCSVTPELKGDVCSNFHHYLSIPMVTEDFHRCLNNRNFWICVKGKDPWSVSGISAYSKVKKWTDGYEPSLVEGEIGAFHLERSNRDLGLRAKAAVFVPSDGEYAELVIIEVENTGTRAVRFTPAYATPIFGRTADNLRDHRNVTSMFNRIFIGEHGTRVKPIINFNEFGHSDNHTSYSVLGFEQDGKAPPEIWGAMKDFIGEGGTLDNPEALVKNLPAPPDDPEKRDGFEAIGAFRFKEKSLAPKESAAYVILHGISEEDTAPEAWKERYGNLEKAQASLEKTRNDWQEIVNQVNFETEDTDLNNWVRWNVFQLICRQVYGNSYLPDFGYGRGGRGWRDLWSDLLSIFLINPGSAREEIINNFRGVRVDGTNATIVGTEPGQFLADRNNVPRTWCDHGSWPAFVTDFYIQQSGDMEILFEELDYWKDVFIKRSRERDEAWTPEYGHRKKTSSGKVYRGSILEHMLLQQLCAFYNVGEHNNILLEGGDWNDTYDMARQRGESVCFYNFYGHNFRILADLLSSLNQAGFREIDLMEEMIVLLDTLGEKVDYSSPVKRQERLRDYYSRIVHNVSGKKTRVKTVDLVRDLQLKQEAVYRHIGQNEWITTKEGFSFFNGHYDNEGKRVHGDHEKGTRIDLTSQVLPTMFGIASEEKVAELYRSLRHFLRNEQTGGLHLCSDFREERLYFGRVTGFVYGHKEHGGIWMQQNIMLLYALYRREFVREGYEVFSDVYRLVMDSASSKVFPCTPSYFEMDGHGSYSYLTGSSTWLILALVTRIFGVRGVHGNLLLQPQLVREQFGERKEAAITTSFRGYRIRVLYRNRGGLDYGHYSIKKVSVNGTAIRKDPEIDALILLEFSRLEPLLSEELNQIEVDLL